MTANSPHVVWILSDQHRADALGSCSNGAVITPHLDDLASEGHRFTEAFCQGPLCVPSRASLLTERYPHDHGVRDNTWQGFRPALPTFVQALRDSGYQTLGAGKMHLYRYPNDLSDGVPTMVEHGFTDVDEIVGKYGTPGSASPYQSYLADLGVLQAYADHLDERNPQQRETLSSRHLVRRPHGSTEPAPLPTEAHPDLWVARRAAAWIECRRDPRPLFAWIGLPGPHDPWDAPAVYRELYDGKDVPSPHTLQRPAPRGDRYGELVRSIEEYGDSNTADASVIKAVRRAYFAGVTMVDDAVGTVVAALERSGLLDNTWVIYSSDHGEMLGEHGLFTKHVFYDDAVRVPLIVRPPGGAEPTTVSELIELGDVPATIRAIAGASPLENAEGIDLRPLMAGQATGRGAVTSGCENFTMTRTRSRKTIVDDRTGAIVREFDLANDPYELRSLV